MSQHDYVLDNAAGGTFRADLNAALAALLSQNAGATAPSTTAAHMVWMDTANSLLKIRNAANNAWITILDLSTTDLRLVIAAGLLATPSLSFAGDPNTGIFAPGADIVALVAGGVEYLRASTSGLQISGTGAVLPPSGTTAQRPGSPVAGMIRYNSTTGSIEGYFSGSWTALGGTAAPSVVVKTSGYTATTAEDMIVCNGSALMAQALYAANAAGRKPISYKNIGAYQVTVTADGSDLIILGTSTGEATLILDPGAGGTFYPDGTDKWYFV